MAKAKVRLWCSDFASRLLHTSFMVDPPSARHCPPWNLQSAGLGLLIPYRSMLAETSPS